MASPAPRVVSGLLQSYDFALTALDYAGVQSRVDDFDNRSLRPALTDWAQSVQLDRPVFSCVGLGWSMVRHGGHKYFVHAQQQTPVLFDLERDPAERQNVANDPHYADIKRELSERLAEHVAKPPLAHLDVGAAPSCEVATAHELSRSVLPVLADSRTGSSKRPRLWIVYGAITRAARHSCDRGPRQAPADRCAPIEGEDRRDAKGKRICSDRMSARAPVIAPATRRW
jgi:hypothetical protein